MPFDFQISLFHRVFRSLSYILVKEMHCETVKFTNAQQAKSYNSYKNTKLKLLKTNAAIWFNKICRNNHLQPKYISLKINGHARQDRRTEANTIRFRITQVDYL